jgi:hypothetical protein
VSAFKEGRVDEFSTNREHSSDPSRRGGYAEWIALGAVVAGSVGAIVGAARNGHSGTRPARLQVDRPESAMLTAPHGDKLFPAL